ncbi:MAG: HAMP domain-containing histidine kinase [Clostridia bacterium]|nr:HAMP domain-containing histidine kinase [Clostridia bacterium]
MRKGSMFSQLLAGFLAVILLCVGVLFALSYYHLRSSRIEARMEALKTQAREMAYLAGQLSTDNIPRAFGQASTTEKLMKWKADGVYRKYNAYIIVYDRYGNQRTYYNEATLRDESMKYLPSMEEYSSYLAQVIQGQEIVVQTDSASGPLFTVIVPIQQSGPRDGYTVSGLVLIQTAAQTVHASYRDLVWQVAVAAIALSLAALIIVFIFTRRVTRPLTAMEKAANSMASGDFTARAPEEGTREMLSLASSFNQMADKLATQEQSRREFVANVSHELRSPITSIQGFAQGILDGTIPKGEQEKYLSIITDETHRLSKLIHSLLSLSRIENEETPLHCTSFDINERIRLAIIARMNELEEKELEIETEFASDPCFVHADADQIQQVLINLLDNAVKFTPKGGRIRFSSRLESNTLFLCIQDDGQGILPEDAPHIFDRFYKADKAHTAGKGTGLGLAICRRIMERHGQSIRLLPSDQGAAFEITLATGKENSRHAD